MRKRLGGFGACTGKSRSWVLCVQIHADETSPTPYLKGKTTAE